MNIIKKCSLLSIILFSLVSCIEPFNIELSNTSSVLIVDDPMITNVKKRQQVKLIKTIPSASSSINTPMTGATVNIIVNDTQKIKFTESEEANSGNYISEIEFAAEANKTYQLEIVLPDGSKYISSKEKLLNVTPITKAYQIFDVTGSKASNVNYGTHKVYIDTQDPANETNYYLWNWRLYEKQAICKSCAPQESYYPVVGDPNKMGTCKKDLPNWAREIIYDYDCSGNCWEILYSKKNIVLSDEFYNGGKIEGVEVATIPYHTASNALIVVSQKSITRNTYQYFRLFYNQNIKSGGLTDTPPATLIGNISQESGPSLPITGYFIVSSEKEYKYVVNRSDIPKNWQYLPIGLMPNGRRIQRENPGVTIGRPPTAPCLNTLTRTNIRPEELPN
jgi:hypothetical protein